MNEHPLPMFDEQPAPAIDAPRKARRKPMRRKVAKIKTVPKPAKKRRKRRTVRAAVVKVPSLAVMFDACAKITEILRTLTPKERTAVLESVGHIA